MTKLIFWNCRGAGKLASRAYLQELARIHHPVAIVLLETRHTSFTRRNIDRLIGREWDYEVVPSSGRVGNSGGIVFLWRGDCISVSNVTKHKYFLTASILIPGGLMWKFAAVYADKDMHRRRVIWEELAKLDSIVPTIIGGDFNCVLREEEKRGGAPFNAKKGPEEFASFITLNNLHEIPFTGDIFTWCNNQDISTRKVSRLDRVLLNAEACIAFPASVVHHLARIGSDHAPLLLELDKMQFTSSRSRQKFEEVWLTKPNVHHVALGAWSKPVSGHPSRVLALKCSRTINALAKWSKFNAKKESEEARIIEKDIKELQMLEGSRVLLESELQRLRLLVAKYNEVQGKLDAWWWQRAKSNWLAHGDRNSAFFQAAATQRKHENRIFMLQRNDEAITDQSEIEKEITKHFSIRWQLKDCTDGSSLPAPCNFVSESEAQFLMTPPTDKEIKNAVFSFGSNKAPGYDGVTHSFFTNFWGFTMVEIIEAVKDFFATCKMEKSWKDTLIMLIPKCSQATLPEHYRPISLCSSIYKVVAKIITSRLKPLLCRLISGEQAAFVPGRLLSDNCIMAQEILHRMHSTESKAGYMAIKIDMEKAFDRMQWSFVRRALEAFKFPADWINLIMECISTPRFGILINGVRSTWIEATCGLRQGCPLSPYLFILCSEFLSLLIRRSEHPGIGIKVCASAQKISHLLYADDTLLFGAATPSTAREFYFILQRYCSFSGEAVNASKSNVLFGPKVPLAAKEAIYQLLGHSEVKALSYLGIKLRPGRVKRADFDNLLDQVACKARCWGSRHLSMAGRVALINSTLAAIPQHSLANTPMPVSVLNKINSMLKNFLWVGARSGHAIHYARWDDVCTPKQQGGLGIKNLIIWRRVMMGKVAARVLASENTLLASTLGSKYGGPNMFRQNRNHSKIWKTICLGKGVVEKHTMWLVGDGSKITTITDTWIGALPIALWPTFVDAATLPKYLKEGLDENGAWTGQFLSKFGPALADFISRLPRVDGGGPDKLVWAHSECSKMNAAAVYAADCQPNDLVGGDFWKLKSQPRMLMLFWRALNSQLPTYKWLRKHHLKDAASCPWGCNAEESLSHIFGNCKFISNVWRECDRMNINIKPSNANLLLYLKEIAEHSRDSFESKFLLSIIYNIWKARNSKVHGENFLQPASIVIAAVHDSCHGSWNVQCNPQSTWTSPPIGWIKVNFDGSVRPNNVAGLGCVIRNHSGEFIIASGAKSYSRSVDMTEFRSACVGLNLAKPFFNTCTGIILEGDSSVACSRLNRILEGMYMGETERSLALTLKDAPRVVVSNIGRSANGAADHVANLACEDDVTWERGMPLPHSLSVLLLHDSDAL